MTPISGMARILIVDDAAENLDILMEALDHGYRLIAARTGEKALEIARRKPYPDLILLDIMMPGLDGYEVCRLLKAESETRDIPILFLTALANEDNELHGLELGAADYIHKPFSIPLIRARVATQLELAKNRRQLAAQVTQLTEAATLRERIDTILRHDLKTPLTPILGFASYLAEATNLSVEQVRQAHVIHNAALKILDMINRSLDLYKMETGNYHYRTEPVQLLPLLNNVIHDLSPLADELGVTTQLNGSDMKIYGEKILYYSLFCNLIKNALEASPNGGIVTIHILNNQDGTTVNIHNKGVIPAEIRGSFFGKFTTTGKHRGTGLGAYSAKLMATTLKGDILMQTNDIEGTTLTVILPTAPNTKAS